MDDTTILGSALGQVGQTVKKAGQQIIKLPEEISNDLTGQVGGIPPRPVSAEDSTGGQGLGRQAKPDVSGELKQTDKQWQSDEERVRFLRDLYGSAEQNSSVKSSDKSASFAPPSGASAAKPEEQKELMKLRSQLHKEVYYDPTFNPVKKTEERPAEKVENEKKQEMQDLEQKEAKKPPPLAVVREQNKAEMFRGAAG